MPSKQHSFVSEPWSTRVQQQFITFAYEQYKKRHGDPCPPAAYAPRWNELNPRQMAQGHQKHLDTLTYLYNLGRGDHTLRISYQEFEDALLLDGGHFQPERCQRRHRHRFHGCLNDAYDHWYPRNGAHYRCKTSNNVSHKERDPEAEAAKLQRLEWREKKGFHRTRNRDGSWRRGCRARSFARTIGNRALRRWEERMIKKGDWEALGDEESSMRLFVDPWDWE